MEQKKKRGRKAKIVTSDPAVGQKDGIILGEYSKSVWNNGELVSFDIDWDKLSILVRQIKVQDNV